LDTDTPSSAVAREHFPDPQSPSFCNWLSFRDCFSRLVVLLLPTFLTPFLLLVPALVITSFLHVLLFLCPTPKDAHFFPGVPGVGGGGGGGGLGCSGGGFLGVGGLGFLFAGRGGGVGSSLLGGGGRGGGGGGGGGGVTLGLFLVLGLGGGGWVLGGGGGGVFVGGFGWGGGGVGIFGGGGWRGLGGVLGLVFRMVGWFPFSVSVPPDHRGHLIFCFPAPDNDLLVGLSQFCDMAESLFFRPWITPV